jgi:hypothetical protein
VRHRLAIGMDVDDHDVVFDGHSGGATVQSCQMGLQRLEIFFLFEVVWARRFSCTVDIIGEDDGSLTARVLDVFDANGDPRANDLFTDERVNDLLLTG